MNITTANGVQTAGGRKSSTIRVAQRTRFTSIDRRTINDRSLSWAALGLLVWVLDKPDGWTFTRESLAAEGGTGVHTVRNLLKELTDHGYIVRTRVRRPDGTFATETLVYETPQATPQPLVDFQPAVEPLSTPQPLAEIPPAVDQPPIEKTEIPNTDNPLDLGISVQETSRVNARKPRVTEPVCSSGTSTANSRVAPPNSAAPPPSRAEPAVRDRATAVVKSWWESQTPRPQSNFIGVVKVVERLLLEGFSDDKVRTGLDGAVCPSMNSIKVAIARSGPRNGQVYNRDNTREARSRGGVAL